MKGAFTLFVLATCAILLLTISSAHAYFFGSDDFNDNSIDSSKWGSELVGGNGVMSETNSQLEYTVSSPAIGFDGVDLPWILNQGSYLHDWDLQLDVGVGDVSVPSGPFNFVASALIVQNGDDPDSDIALIELGLFRTDGVERYFLANFIVDNVFAGPSVFTPTSSEAGAVRIAFDASSKNMFFQYDADGFVGGYIWDTLRTEDITAWNMTDTSVFNAFVGFGSGGVTVTSGMVTADNFNASTIPEPSTLLLLGAGLAGINVARRKLRTGRQPRHMPLRHSKLS